MKSFGILFIPGFALWASGRGSPRLHRAWARVPVAGLQRGMAVSMDVKNDTSNRFHNFPHLFKKIIKRMTDVCSWLPTSIDDMLCLYNVQSPPSQTYMILVGYDFDWGLGETLLFILFWVCGCSRVPCFIARTQTGMRPSILTIYNIYICYMLAAHISCGMEEANPPSTKLSWYGMKQPQLGWNPSSFASSHESA
jgi:hypothetical protein